MNQPDLLPDHPDVAVIEVQGADLARADERIRQLNGVLLGFAVKGATYKLRVLLPPGAEIERLLEGDNPLT